MVRDEYGFEMLTEPEAVAVLGAERFRRVRSLGFLPEFLRVKGHEGTPLFLGSQVDFRLFEDREILGDPPHRRPAAVVTKSHTGGGAASPEARPHRDAHREEILDRYAEAPDTAPAAGPDAGRGAGLTPELRARLGRLLDRLERALRDVAFDEAGDGGGDDGGEPVPPQLERQYRAFAQRFRQVFGGT